MQAPFLCPLHAEDIPYREGPHGGQIIDLDGPAPAGTGQNPEYVDPRDGAATGQAPKIKIPPRNDPPDWNKIREQMNGRQDNLQPFSQSDARRLDEEFQARQRRLAEIEAHRQKVRERRANPSAQDLDLMMRRLDDPKFTTAEKQRMAAVLFVHQDTYRNAVAEGAFGANTGHVQTFLEHKKQLQRDVIDRMGKKYMQKYGKPLKEPIIPFDYNNIHSDDDVVTGGSKQSAELERLYAESLDEIIRERAGRPMSAADRKRVDVNGLAWDMTQRGGLENFWHPEKYINPQSGFANQQKLIGAGDKLNVYTFDNNGKLVKLQGEDAVEAIRKLDVDRPMQIPGIDAEVGSGSMSDYIRMAEIHKVKFVDGKDVTVAEVLQFIRNQKYTQRVDGDFGKISADTHPEIYKEYKRYLEAVEALRQQTTIRGAAEILEKLYGDRIIDPRSGLVDYDALKTAMQKHQNTQLNDLFPKMHSAVTQNEAFKIAEWLKSAGRGKRAELRKQLALTYAPMDEAHRAKIVADLDKLDIDAESRAFLKTVIDQDAKQIVRYAQLLELETLTLTKSLKLDGDNFAIVDRHIFENAKVKRLGDAVWNRPGGSKFKEFLRTKTARALNLDVMLGSEIGTRGEKVFQWSVVLLAAGRAYSAGSDQTDSFKKVAAGLFEMIPGVAATLRFSEGEFRQSFKELCMDVLPPVALADLAVQVLNYTATYAINEFNESKLDQLAEQVLSEMTDDDFEESEDIPGYFRIKDKKFLFEYLEETSAGLGKVAKFPALVTQQVDALQRADKTYQTNMAALHTLGYFEEVAVDNLDALIRKQFDLTQLKARVWEQGVPGVGQASPVERVAAKIVAENLTIRARAYEKILHLFIDRIEDLYNKEYGHARAIITETQKKLKELYENAPQVVKDSAYASAELKEEYRMRVEYLKDYKPGDKNKGEVAREMQELLDNFRETIEQLVVAAGFFDEQRDLDLQANYYGGDYSMEPLLDHEILSGDEFRVGISAKVSRHRKDQKWTVYYYVFRDDKWIVLGSQSLKPGKYSEGSGLMVIEEPDKDTFIHVKGQQLEDYFSGDSRGYYRVHPVLAFGDWDRDPIAEVGLEALRAPAEYFELFSAEKMAFTGPPLEIMTIRPRVIVQVPEYVYQNDPVTEAYVVVDVPPYAKEDAEDAEVELLLPDVGGGQPSVSPESFSPVSTDPDNPDVIRISFPEDALDGEHALLVRVRMRRLAEDDQPGGADYFQYLREENPDGSGDGGGEEDPADAGGEPAQSLDALLASIEALEAQAEGFKGQADNLADALRGTDRDISRSINGLTEQVAQLEAEADALRDAPLDRANPDTIGLYEKDVYSAGQRLGEIRSRISDLTIRVCEAYEQVKATTDVDRLDSIYGDMTAQLQEVDRLNTEYKRLVGQMKSLKQRAEQEAGKAGGVSPRLQSAESRVSSLVTQAARIADQIGQMQTAVDQIRGVQGQVSALTQEAVTLVDQAHALPEESL
ncbi:MAG: hypothetical protein KC897_07965, partial [Candidatus Omnitrophica bacterium]|nr:hypothetical protein [Candidatus Omnitrophota bacterium]